ncbi:MAG: thrombospondin type 3 repeat-containing protein [bacterium]
MLTIVFLIITAMIFLLSVTTKDTVVQAAADQYTSQRSDSDGDGIEDSLDNCPNYWNPEQYDADGDGIGNPCDECTDQDGDGFGDPGFPSNTCPEDNCPGFANSDQTDTDGDGIGDSCEQVKCGDADGNDIVGPGDLFFISNFLWRGGLSPACMYAANTDGCEGVNVYDPVYTWSRFVGSPLLNCDGPPDCPPLTGGVISLDHVDGLLGPDTVLTDKEIVFHIRMFNNLPDRIRGLTNGFRVYSPTGATWSGMTVATVIAIDSFFDVEHIYRSIGVTGSDSDTALLGYMSWINYGLPVGFDSVTHTITIGPIDRMYSGGEICLDSSWYPPGGDWIWATVVHGSSYFKKFAPSWDGPHCFPILYCCDIRGDVDRSGAIDVGDLTNQVAYLFQGGPSPPCPEEADVDGSSSIDVGDLTYLVAYLFQGGPSPAPC